MVPNISVKNIIDSPAAAFTFEIVGRELCRSWCFLFWYRAERVQASGMNLFRETEAAVIVLNIWELAEMGIWWSGRLGLDSILKHQQTVMSGLGLKQMAGLHFILSFREDYIRRLSFHP